MGRGQIRTGRAAVFLGATLGAMAASVMKMISSFPHHPDQHGGYMGEIMSP